VICLQLLSYPVCKGGATFLRSDGPRPVGCCCWRPESSQHSSRPKWHHRSSRLNAQYQVIYKVEERRILVVVMDVTAHDDRRQ
jgi:hypothetical protein